MMTCVEAREMYPTQGRNLWRVLILADETPDPMPLTGADVERMPDAVRIDVGSVLANTHSGEVFVLGPDGETWDQWGEEAGE